MFISNRLKGIRFYSLYFILCLWAITAGDWIDMPEFSDETKIYRIPSAKHDQFYKFSKSNTRNNFPYEYRNSTYDVEPQQALMNDSVEPFKDFKLNDFTEDPIVSDISDGIAVTTEKYDTTKSGSADQNCYNESLNEKDEILEYLPVDILKNVHRILKSQPVSTEGKIQFLKTFEKTLITEIEARLFSSIASNREKRGADHSYHGYDDHEDHHSVGFPSIEGALMAISFLTFAVYLVRLVMLLFRNMNNSTPTTTGATVFLGKRKRSIDRFDDNTANILSSVEAFASNL